MIPLLGESVEYQQVYNIAEEAHSRLDRVAAKTERHEELFNKVDEGLETVIEEVKNVMKVDARRKDSIAATKRRLNDLAVTVRRNEELVECLSTEGEQHAKKFEDIGEQIEYMSRKLEKLILENDDIKREIREVRERNAELQAANDQLTERLAVQEGKQEAQFKKLSTRAALTNYKVQLLTGQSGKKAEEGK